MIEIDFDENEIKHAQHILNHVPKKLPIVAARALNRAATVGRTQLSREVRKEYTVKHGTILKAIKIDKAFASKLSSQIQVKGSPIFLTEFKTSPARRGKRSKVYASVKTGQRRAIPSGFLGRAPSGRAIYTRTSQKRFPIKALYGPSVPQMAGNETVSDNVGNAINKELIKRLNHEMDFLLGG